jgi:acetyl-CoA carboxylase carboxyl transferase subunit alpha
VGGAQRHRDQVIKGVGKALNQMLKKYDGKSGDQILAARRKKFLDLGSKGLAA